MPEEFEQLLRGDGRPRRRSGELAEMPNFEPTTAYHLTMGPFPNSDFKLGFAGCFVGVAGLSEG